MSHNPVGWFEIYVADMARARKFYEATFNLTLQALPSPLPDLELWAFPMVDARGASGALVKHPMRGPSGDGVLIYFSCEDCAKEAVLLEQAGGRLMQAKTSIGPYGFIALAHDSEGNAIGLHSMQ